MPKRKRSAGGTAVNAGSEYQHRVGAFISTLMITQAELSLLGEIDIQRIQIMLDAS
jgi:hypothetical protein